MICLCVGGCIFASMPAVLCSYTINLKVSTDVKQILTFLDKYGVGEDKAMDHKMDLK